MTVTKGQRNEQAAARDTLRRYFPQGSTVYTILRHVSASGMTRSIGVVAVVDGEPRDYSFRVAQAGLFRPAGNGRDGLKVSGAGMDMGFHVVYTLAQALYGDGYALSHRWL